MSIGLSRGPQERGFKSALEPHTMLLRMMKKNFNINFLKVRSEKKVKCMFWFLDTVSVFIFSLS